MKLRLFRFLLFTLSLALVGYLRFPALAATRGVPRIEQFTTSSPAVSSGEPVFLSWRLSGAEARSVRVVSEAGTATLSGNALKVEPTLSSVYTLIAQNRQGSDQRGQVVQVQGVTVAGLPESGGAPSGSGGAAEADAGEPDGSFGVSLSPDGPFVSDEAGSITDLQDERVVRVPPGGEFFAEVAYRDPDGIAGVTLNLVNSAPEGLSGTLSPDQPPFSVVDAPTGTCDLGLLPTAVRCLYRVRVAEDARNISELPGAGNEFAYVFRVQVSDGAGDYANEAVRGYVAVSPR